MLHTVLPYFIVVAMIATAIVLFEGMSTMVSHDLNREQTGNLMMRWRVGLQALTLALLALFYFLN